MEGRNESIKVMRHHVSRTYERWGADSSRSIRTTTAIPSPPISYFVIRAPVSEDTAAIVQEITIHMLLVRQSKHLHSLHAAPPISLEYRTRLLILARNYATKSPQDDNPSTPSPTSSTDLPRSDSKSSKLNRSHQSSRKSNSEQNDASSTFFLPETWYRQAKSRKTNKKWNSFLASTSSSEGSGTSSPKAPKNRG